MSVAIKFQDISKSYDDNTIINDFNLEIEEKSFISIVGSSGSGKTTILKMVNRLITPDTGKIFVNGIDISKKDPVELRRNMGYSIQGSVLFPHLTVEENIAYVPNLLNKNNKEKTEKAVKKWMNIVNLDENLLSRRPFELSGGQSQRVGIARSLAASPDILLMDEPFGAVDAITRQNLQEEIKRIHEETGITIVFVTHDINEALYLGDKVLVMDNGEIQQYDAPKRIIDNPSSDFVEQLTKGRNR